MAIQSTGKTLALIRESEWCRRRNIHRTTGRNWRLQGRLIPEATINGKHLYSPNAEPLTDAELAARQQGDAA